MAEVYLGRAEGPAGFSKRLVIKRILPELAQDKDFVEMFLDEARLAALLEHPNVVQVFDFGEDAGQYYLAMEFIQGVSLRSLISLYRRQGRDVPYAASAQIVAGVCEGLQYAHRLCDDAGRSHNIIHRDISPDNIIVSVAGIPKVLDFGIAKAASRVTRTEGGLVKGKYAYMSPEQIRNQPLNQQVDIYALGVVLFECLCGKRPFEADTELSLINAIISGDAKPMHAFNPRAPAPLAEAASRAMAADLALRHPEARALQQDLERYLVTVTPRWTTSDLAALVVEARQALGATDSGPLKQVPGTPSVRRSMVTVGPPGPIGAIDVDLGTIANPPSGSRPADAPVSASTGAERAAEAKQARRRHRRRVRTLVLGAAAALAVVTAVWVARQPSSHSPGGQAGGGPALSLGKAAAQEEPTPVQPPAPAPLPAPVQAKPEKVAKRALLKRPEKARTPGRVAATPPAAAAPAPAAAMPAPQPQGAGFLTVRTDPWSEVYLDGTKLGTTPLVRLPLKAGRHELKIVNPEVGWKEVRKVEIHDGREEVVKAVWR
jgi:serine/threonine-protein kinase